MELKELYQEIILDHAKILGTKVNAKDIITMQKHIILYVEIRFTFTRSLISISGLSFEGEGCAISLASASILTDILKGRDLQFSKSYR